MIICPMCKKIIICKVEIKGNKCQLCIMPHLQFVPVRNGVMVAFDNSRIIDPPFYLVKFIDESFQISNMDEDVPEMLEIMKRTFKVTRRAITRCVVTRIEPHNGIYKGYLHTVWWNDLEEV